MENIDKTIEYVKNFFENDYSGHDFYHTMRVYNLAKHIASFEKCDTEIVALSALLHDVDDIKIVGIQEEKYINAKNFLRKQNYPEEKIENICHIISQVSFKGKDTEKPDNIEGMIVQDADRLDAIGAIGIGRTFAYGGSHQIPMHIPGQAYNDNMTSEEYYNFQQIVYYLIIFRLFLSILAYFFLQPNSLHFSKHHNKLANYFHI